MKGNIMKLSTILFFACFILLTCCLILVAIGSNNLLAMIGFLVGAISGIIASECEYHDI